MAYKSWRGAAKGKFCVNRRGTGQKGNGAIIGKYWGGQSKKKNIVNRAIIPPQFFCCGRLLSEPTSGTEGNFAFFDFALNTRKKSLHFFIFSLCLRKEMEQLLTVLDGLSIIM